MPLISINNTKAAYNILKRRMTCALKTYNIIVHIIFMLLYIYYLIFNNEGYNVYVYSVLLVVNIVSFVFMFLFNITKEDDNRAKFRKRRNKRVAKNILSIFKYTAKFFALIYTFINIHHHGATDLTKILTIASAILTIILLIFEVLYNIVSKYINLFMLGFEKDMNESSLVNAKRSIDNFFGKGKEAPNTNYSKAEEKMINLLDSEIETMKKDK